MVGDKHPQRLTSEINPDMHWILYIVYYSVRYCYNCTVNKASLVYWSYTSQVTLLVPVIYYRNITGTIMAQSASFTDI